jgi:hypothetical protein
MAELKSLFAQAFKNLQAHIKTQVPEVRWIDHDLGQLEVYDIKPPVTFPCVLIDFNQTSYEQMQLNRQLGNITFTLRIGFETFSTTANTAPADVIDKGLQFYELEQLLYEAVQDYDFGGLMQESTRVNTATERRDGDSYPMRVRVMTFTSMTEDASAMEKRTVTSRPPLELEDYVSDGIEVQDVGLDLEVS